MRIVDSHCHLNIIKRKQLLPEIIAAAQQHHVVGLLNISVELDEIPQLQQQCQLMPNMWISAGIHPCHSEPFVADYQELLQAAQQDRVIAVGESGLDFFHKPQAQCQHQFAHFYNHLAVAKQLQKPLIIHCRNAAKEVIEVLQQHQAEQCGGVMHCFAEDQATAAAALELGFYISFSGIVTYNSAQPLQQIARDIPLHRLLVETDAPYLSPAPMRGKPNQPAYVSHTLAFIAQLRGIDVAELAAITTQNFETCFQVQLR